MKITKKELIEMGACSDGLKRFIAQTGNTDEAVEVSSLVGGENKYSDLVWLATKKLPKERIVRFSCDCALVNIELIKPYTHEYDEIVEFLHNPTREAADVVCGAAARTVFAIHADVVCGATDHAACAARTAHAAGATIYGAGTTAAVAATNTSRAAGKEKVNELLRELFS